MGQTSISIRMDEKIGKPEPLVGDLGGYWSMRIDDCNHLFNTVCDIWIYKGENASLVGKREVNGYKIPVPEYGDVSAELHRLIIMYYINHHRL